MEQYIRFLSGTELFGVLNEDKLRSIFEDSKYTINEYAKGQIIHIQNDICEHIDVVISGCLNVKRVDVNGRTLQVGEFAVSNIIGANLIFASKNVYPMMVTAKCNTTIMHIHKDTIMRLCGGSMEFMTALFRSVSDKVMVLTDKINQISLKSIRDRIIEYLEHERKVQNSNIIKLEITKTQLAERFGIPRSSLGRELNKMRSDGMITYDARTVTIINLQDRNDV